MDHDKLNQESLLKRLMPLIGVFGFVTAATLTTAYLLTDFSLMSVGTVFMGFFFLTFGSFKLYNLEGFQKAFKSYDILAEKSSFYAKAYPFLEIGLGAAYFTTLFQPELILQLPTYSITVIVMALNGGGVLNALVNGRDLQCACLGDVFNVPMTWVTLFEDALMAVMALFMIITIV